MMDMKRYIVVILMLVVVLAASTTVSSAESASQAAYIPACTLTATFSPSSGPPGSTITVSGESDSPVSVMFCEGGVCPESTTATPMIDGTYSATITVPAEASVGYHEIQVSNDCGLYGIVPGFEVTGSGEYDYDTYNPYLYNAFPTGNITTTDTVIGAEFHDFPPSSGINPDATIVLLDGSFVSGCVTTGWDTGEVSCPVSGLAYGSHQFSVQIQDYSGRYGLIDGYFSVSPPLGCGVVNVATPTTVTVDSGDAARIAGSYDGLDGLVANMSWDSGSYFPVPNPFEVYITPPLIPDTYTVSFGSEDLSCPRGVVTIIVQSVCDLTVTDVNTDKISGPVGSSFSVSGHYTGTAQTNGWVYMVLPGDLMRIIGTIIAENGAITGSATIPADITPGDYQIGIHLGGAICVWVQPFDTFAVTGRPTLSVGIANVYWGSYADYTDRELSVDYRVYNKGANDAYNINITESSNTNGVLAGNLPVTVGDVSAGGNGVGTVRYLVPPGVGFFRASLQASAEDSLGYLHTYP